MIKTFTKDMLIDCSYLEFFSIIHDLIQNENVQNMRKFNQHANTSCYQHCMKVAYYTYVICKLLKLDYISATRGAMLHDLFLYDWHEHYNRENKKLSSLHAFNHPKVALKNANAVFKLNKIEQDVIVKHMWPITLSLPRYPETFVVTCTDKYSAARETYLHFIHFLHSKKTYKYAYLFLSLIVFRII